jgi:hypothetical protein
VEKEYHSFSLALDDATTLWALPMDFNQTFDHGFGFMI